MGRGGCPDVPGLGPPTGGQGGGGGHLAELQRIVVLHVQISVGLPIFSPILPPTFRGAQAHRQPLQDSEV